MVRLTPDHWEAFDLRTQGWSINLISLYQDCAPDEVEKRVFDAARVLVLQALDRMENADGETDGG